ncbi:putative flippase GtrA [Paraburkholderia eburnea]|uniref:Putative flippase GtrA n=1 Tax=Paraburkholderia eburnea TaxID=1189126 RepID=A0A2S4MMD9_9BURK|nr:GtrA family protein [Paraburkholderia eburnea]POR55910.1 putative flippase GtrA [Paraburkholderia eburnea]PRZ27037.1 putative flippase GtrA [Paraburkholderia eburnea]
MPTQQAASYRMLQQFFRFFLVGSAGFVVNAVLVELLVHLTKPVTAQLLAFPVAVTVTWWLNRRYTFGASRHALHYEWLRYVFGNIFGWIINNGVYIWFVLHVPLTALHPAIAVAVGSVAGMFLNFAMSRWLVFRQ